MIARVRDGLRVAFERTPWTYRRLRRLVDTGDNERVAYWTIDFAYRIQSRKRLGYSVGSLGW